MHALRADATRFGEAKAGNLFVREGGDYSLPRSGSAVRSRAEEKMLRIILTVLCLTIGLPALAATDGATLLSDADSSRVISSLVQPSTLFLFLCATVFAAWFGGVGSGLIAAALSVLAFDYFFLPPIHSLNLMLVDLPRLALFALAALFVVGLVAAHRKATASLRRSRADLEDKVRDLEKLNAALQVENAERERAEKRARETERELQATIDMIPVKITVYRADGARHSVNRPWRDYTGLSQELSLIHISEPTRPY